METVDNSMDHMESILNYTLLSSWWTLQSNFNHTASTTNLNSMMSLSNSTLNDFDPGIVTTGNLRTTGDQLISNTTNMNTTTAAAAALITTTTSTTSNKIAKEEIVGGEADYSQRNAILAVVYYIEIPVITALGLFGNVMGILMLQTDRNLKQLASNLFLVALAASSSIFLISLVLVWSETIFPHDINVYGFNRFGCKMITFVGSASDFACIWFIVAISLDRVVMLYWPMGRKKLYHNTGYGGVNNGGRRNSTSVGTKNLPKLFILGIIGVACGIHIWVLIVADVTDEYGCGIMPGYDVAWEYLTLAETIYSIIIPSVIVIVANIFVIYKLAVYRQYIPDSLSVTFDPNTSTAFISTNTTNCHQSLQIQNLLAPDGNGTTAREGSNAAHKPLGSTIDSNGTAGGVDGAGGAGGVEPSVTQSFMPRLSIQHHIRNRNFRPQDIRMTKSLVTVTSVFVLLNLPHYFYRLLLPSDSETTLVVLSMHVSYLMYYLHHAFLFFFYVFNSAKMRKQLKPAAMKLLECYCLKPVPDFGHS